MFYPFPPCYSRKPLAAVYNEHKKRKKLEYGRRVREVEQASFTPLVFTANGGMAPEATVTCTFKRLASLLAHKRNETYG